MTITDRMVQLTCAVVLLVLGGCASMDKQECQVADWRLIGYQDGTAGKPAGAIGDYRKDCAEFAVVPDLDNYLSGREEGLVEFCKPEVGFRIGQSGRNYNSVCPPATAGAFHDAWVDGRAIYHARSAVNSTDEQIRKRKLEVGELQHEKQDMLADLVEVGLRSEQRILILYDIHSIEQDINDLEHEIRELELELEHQQDYLATLTLPE
jgi:hypothetical protein